jgi:FdhD protein
MEPIRETSVIKVEAQRHRRIDDVLVQERQVALFVGGERLLEVVCSPGRLRELAYGHLLAIGRIRALADVAAVEIDDEELNAAIQLEDGLPSPLPEPEVVRSAFCVSEDLVFRAAQVAQSHGELFQATGGTHLAAVVPSGSDCIPVEDISRTCAMEKAVGAALLRGVAFDRSLLVLTSRVPMGFVRAAARAGFPIIAAVSAPTYQAVVEAQRLGMCLCGFVRGARLNVYSQPWRVGLG